MTIATKVDFICINLHYLFSSQSLCHFKCLSPHFWNLPIFHGQTTKNKISDTAYPHLHIDTILKFDSRMSFKRTSSLDLFYSSQKNPTTQKKPRMSEGLELKPFLFYRAKQFDLTNINNLKIHCNTCLEGKSDYKDCVLWSHILFITILYFTKP